MVIVKTHNLVCKPIDVVGRRVRHAPAGAMCALAEIGEFAQVLHEPGAVVDDLGDFPRVHRLVVSRRNDTRIVLCRGVPRRCDVRFESVEHDED